MPLPPAAPGDVYWSASAQRFYQEGRRGALSNLEALEHLTQRRTVYGVRFVDEKNRLVPAIPTLIPKRFNIPGIERLREASISARAVYRDRAPANAYYSTLTTYVDSEGKLHVVLKGFRAETPISRELETKKLIAQVAADERLPKEENHSEEILKRILTRFHFIVR